MTRPPPTSTLFPYTTLFRSGIDFIGRPRNFGKQKREEYVLHDYHKVSDEIKPGWDLSGAVEDIALDRKSTRLNSSHTVISYAVFCLKKKNKNNNMSEDTTTK